MKILYIGPLFPGSTALHRMWALQSLGCEIEQIDSTLPWGCLGSITPLKRFGYSAAARTNALIDWKGVNAKISAAAKRQQWDILWVDKGQWIKPEILESFRSIQPTARLVNYSPDDMFNPNNQTRRWLNALPIYDLYLTTKTYNVNEYKESGAKDAMYVGNGFEPSVHKPHSLSAEELSLWKNDVVFVGACEFQRERSVEYLAKKGVALGLFGGGNAWSKLSERYPKIRSNTAFVADATYAKILCASKIALGFLRKANRDLQTTRSIEIPACGVFMLAERTDEHLSLFVEGKEAEFFESDQELLDKIQFYLRNSTQRKAIAQAGRERCIASGYSNADRLSKVFDYFRLIKKDSA